MKRKYPHIFIAILLLVLLWTSPVLADNEDLHGKIGDNITYTITLSESPVRMIVSGSGEIPSVPEGRDSSYYFNDFARQAPKEIVIENGITGIGDYVFCNFTNLEKITLAGSVTKIGEGTFAGCSSLTSFTLPASVTELDSYAFFGCPKLSTFKVSSSNKVYSAKNNIVLKDGGKSILFIAPGIEGDVNIPSGVTKLPVSIFEGISGKVEDLIIPASVTEIEGWVLDNGNIMFPFVNFDGVQINLANKVFESVDGCIYHKTEKILIWVPWNYSKTTLAIKSGTKCLSPGVLDNMDFTNIKKITIPASFELFDPWDFKIMDVEISVASSNPYYKSVNGNVYSKDGKTLVYAWDNFEDCSFLDGVEIIGEHAVIGGSIAGGTLVIPDSVKYIGAYAFERLESVSNAVIGKNVEYIGEKAFYKVSGFTFNGDAPEAVPAGDNGSFAKEKYGKDILICFYPENEGWSTPEWNGYKTFALGGWQNLNENISWKFDETTHVLTIRGTGDMPEGPYLWADVNESMEVHKLVIEDGVTSVGDFAFVAFEKMKKAVLPESVIKIGESAFEDCRMLEEVNIPSGVTRIEAKTFDGCNKIPELDLPEGLTYIGNEAFNYLSRMKKLVIPENVEYIGDKAFYGADQLEEIVFEGPVKHMGKDSFRYNNAIKELVLPEGLETAGEGAFSSLYNLEKVTVPSTLKEIPYNAFDYCHNMKEVIINDGVEIVGPNAFDLCKSIESIVFPASIKTMNPSWDMDSFSKAYFLGTPPTNDLGSGRILPTGTTIYYVDGKAGWTSPLWNGYKTELWDGGGKAVIDHNDVIYMIDNLDEITVDAIQRIRGFYDDLSEEEKVLVTNIGVFTDAEKKLEEIITASVNEVIKMISALGDDVLEEKDRILEAMAAYEALGAYGDRVTNYDVLKKKYDELMSYSVGDVNADGEINALDATQILRYANGKSSVIKDGDEKKIFVADVNKDGSINALDATQILRYANSKSSVIQ